MSHKTHNTGQPIQTTVLLVGGGTGGHIFPLYPLCEELIAQGAKTHLLVNDATLDKKIVQQTFSKLPKLQTHYLKAHKLHYHLSLENLLNPFKIIASFWRARKLLRKIQPDVIFFKGGFVGLPILFAAKYLMKFKGKIYLHESDISSGALTNLFGKHADQTFSNFGKDATPLFYWPKFTPQLPATSGSKPTMLIFGGSQGAQFINNLVLNNLNLLCKKYRVVLVAGPGKNNPEVTHKGLEVHEFLEQDKLIEQIIYSDLVVTRSGASMFQVLAAQKPMIAIPLPTAARNHQHENAQYFSDKNLCYLLEQNKGTQNKFLPMVDKITHDKALAQNLTGYGIKHDAQKIAKQILS